MKPRLMIISPVTPYPVFHGAGSTIFGYLRALRSDFDLFFAGFCPQKLLERADEGLRMICADVAVMAPPEQRHLNAFSRTPFYFSNLRDDRLQQMCDAMYRSAKPDIVQVEYLSMGDYAAGMKCMRLMRAHVQDWWHFYLGWKQALSRWSRLTHFVGSCDTILQNRRTMRAYDRILVTHEAEGVHVLQLVPEARVESLPFLLMDCEQFAPYAELPRAPNIVFVGFLPHTPNEEGLRWFLEKVWPLVRHEEPEAKLTVVGAGASNHILGLMHDCGVEYRGFVEDLRALYASSRVYISPIFTGGGIRTKIIEAMTAGIPIVSSTFAPWGIGTQEGEHLLASDSPAGFAQHILRLFVDDALARRLRRKARAFVENNYSLQSQGPAVAQRYRRFLLERAA